MYCFIPVRCLHGSSFGTVARSTFGGFVIPGDHIMLIPSVTIVAISCLYTAFKQKLIKKGYGKYVFFVVFD